MKHGCTDALIEETIRREYTLGKSAQEIGERLGLSWRQVIYRMERHGIERRTRSQATYCKRNTPGDPFAIKKRLNLDEEKLKALALGLYWGEGTRSNKISIRLGNSDAALLSIFITFLRRICGVPLGKIKVWVIVHSDTNVKKAEDFWSKKLGIPLEQFSRTTVAKPRGKGTYKKTTPYGTATVQVHNSKLRKIFGEWLDAYAAVAQSEERSLGKAEGMGSIPIGSSEKPKARR